MNKAYLLMAAMMFVAMLVIPLAARGDNSTPALPASGAVNTAADGESTKSDGKHKSEKIKLLDKESNQVKNIGIEEYLIGVTAAEIDASYEDEAIKAQAVAAHTMALYRKAENADNDYDITSDSATDQSYIDKDARKKKWGGKADEYEKRLTALIKEVKNCTVTYDGEPILAAYHSVSGGKTESAKNVWGKDYPYLQPVQSVSDMLAPDYVSTVTYTCDEFKSLAKSLNTELSGEAKDMISAPKCTESGTVLEYKLGGKTVSGRDMRDAFNLRSANFDLSESDNKLVFTVRGYGHGVGMSQYGANCMAQQGETYDKILKWYYKGCEINS